MTDETKTDTLPEPLWPEVEEVIHSQGEDPEALVAQAAKNVDAWRGDTLPEGWEWDGNGWAVGLHEGEPTAVSVDSDGDLGISEGGEVAYAPPAVVLSALRRAGVLESSEADDKLLALRGELWTALDFEGPGSDDEIITEVKDICEDLAKAQGMLNEQFYDTKFREARSEAERLTALFQDQLERANDARSNWQASEESKRDHISRCLAAERDANSWRARAMTAEHDFEMQKTTTIAELRARVAELEAKG